jgi:hypothetical protein
MRRNTWQKISCLALTLGIAGCDPDPVDPEVDAGRDTGTEMTDTGTEMTDTGTETVDVGIGEDGGGGPPVWCPAPAEPGPAPTCSATPTEVVVAGGNIAADTTWDCDNVYRLTGIVYVTGGTLTIEAGTRVIGDSGSALVITRDGEINAVGHPSAPIVFTSSVAVGTRDRGNWGGVVLLGRAPINVTSGENRIEGIAASEVRTTYGGTDAAHDCGTIRYARIEFAGFELTTDNELNGLTVGGCGTGTTLDHIQVHMGDDDGIEFFGGTVGMSYVLVTRAADDSLDWDFGWNGRVQYLAIQQDPGAADMGFESDNSATAPLATPISSPTIYNATMIGTNDTVAGGQRAMLLRRGTHGTMRNFIVQGFPANLRVDGDESIAAVASGMLSIGNSIFFESGTGAAPFEGGTAPTAWVAAGAMNRVGVDPELADPYDLTAPDLTTTDEAVVRAMAATPPTGFDTNAVYLGAFGPGCDDWTTGWTAFPAN